MMKMTELAEMAIFTCFIREKTITAFVHDWKSFMDFLQKKEKSTCTVIYGIIDY